VPRGALVLGGGPGLRLGDLDAEAARLLTDGGSVAHAQPVRVLAEPPDEVGVRLAGGQPGVDRALQRAEVLDVLERVQPLPAGAARGNDHAVALLSVP
jgi:hypothetical protein